MSQATPSIVPNWTSRQVVLATLVVLAVILGFWFLYHFRLMIITLFVAIVIGTAILPITDWLSRRGLHPALGGILVYLVLLVLITGLGWLIVPLLTEQVVTITASLPDYYQSLRDFMVDSPNRLLWRLGQQLPPQLPGFAVSPQTGNAATAPQAEDENLASVVQAITYTRLIGWGTFLTVATLLISFYWILERQRAIRSLLLLFPMSWRDEARELITVSEAKVGAYVRGQSILCLIIGVLSLIAYLLIGLPYALVLALIAGLMEAVPWIGPILGTLPAILIALSVDPSKVIWVIAAAAIIQPIENYVLVPRIMDKSVGVSSLVVLLSFAAFGSLLGILGTLLAIPMAAIIQLLLDRFLLKPDNLPEQEVPTGRGSLSVLRYETQTLIQDMRKYIRDKDDLLETEIDQVEEKIEAIATDLDSILAQSATSEVTAS